MKRLVDMGSGQFTPSGLLQSMAEEGKRFYSEKGGG
jgi:hypothetical protein